MRQLSFANSLPPEDSLRFGILVSTVAHILLVIIAAVALRPSSDLLDHRQIVYTVTLAPGKRIGGISQVPTTKEKQDTRNAAPADAKLPEAAKEPVKKEIKKPSVVEEQKAKKAEEAKKKAEKEKELEKKKKAEEEKEKKQADEAKKKDDAKKEEERKQRDKELAEAVERAQRRYEGESANAGGVGFGAAATGGTGMGGGTQASLEFIAYRNTIERAIKGGWRWVPGVQVLRAQIYMLILPTGVIQEARVDSSSGNSTFDNSALRAVYKASPLPPPPADLYNQFKEVRITFDSQE